MSDQFWQAFFASLPALVISIGTFIVTIVNIFHLNEVHKQVNSRMDQLLITTADKSRAEGIKQEVDRIK